MADDERRMLFDIRGRRKNVVRVVYATLAVLMGLSLLLVVGPAPLQDIFGIENSVSDASEQFEEQAERIEAKLRKDPQNADLLLSLTRARINAGNSLVVPNPETGGIAYTQESRQQLEAASESWSKYLKATDEPSSGGAQVAAQALFALAETSRTTPEVAANIAAAAKAQAIVAAQRPSLGSLSTLAIYRYYDFDYDGAEQARKQATTYANTKFDRENLGNELDQIEKRAREFEKQVTEIEKAAAQAREKGEPSLANPLAESNPLASP